MIKLNNLTMLKKIFPALVITIGLASCNSTTEEVKEQAQEATNVNEDHSRVAESALKHTETKKPSDMSESSTTNTEETDPVAEKEELEKPESSTDTEEMKIVVKSATEELKEATTDKMTSSLPVAETPTETAIVEEVKKIEEAKEVIPFSHTIFNGLLKKYVTSSGKVNYNGFKADRAKLQEYIALLKDNEPGSSWSSNKKLAYWINVYNANMIEVMLKNNIPSSVMSINNGKAWDLKVVKIGSKTYSLNDVEHNIIRKQFKEPRIHFACVCAAKSCPKLLNKAYTEANLKSSLQAQAVYFINNTSKNEITAKNLKVSQLFNWYASDFGDINTYIRKYSKTEFKDDKDIEFQEYDWSINN